MAFPDTDGVRIFAKLEGQNPSGSIKDRIVKAMVEQAETQGRLKSGDTIIEASSGNTAIASCMVGKQRGYNVTVVIPPEVVPSIADILRLLGAEVVWCEPGLGMKGAIDHAQALAKANGWQYLGQFDDRTNMETHYAATGREIVEALDPVDVFVAGIGTAGTIMGVGKRLKEANPKVKVIGVEPRMGQSLQGTEESVGRLCSLHCWTSRCCREGFWWTAPQPSPQPSRLSRPRGSWLASHQAQPSTWRSVSPAEWPPKEKRATSWPCSPTEPGSTSPPGPGVRHWTATAT